MMVSNCCGWQELYDESGICAKCKEHAEFYDETKENNMTCSDCNSVVRLDKNKRDEFEALARPLIEFLNDNLHPHAHITITTINAEVSEGLCAFSTNDYIKD